MLLESRASLKKCQNSTEQLHLGDFRLFDRDKLIAVTMRVANFSLKKVEKEKKEKKSREMSGKK
eukprot:06788.XXX_5236_5427_1 [CDS] Oithona nana genome sequencing.